MINSYTDALAYLYNHIPNDGIKKFPGELGLARMKTLMSELGKPQDQYPVIHVAGTSGKGSTATLISHALVSQGFTVGLHLSPHLLDIRERVQLNNGYISEEKFVQYLNELLPVIEKIESGEFGRTTYFEILVALAYYTFWKERVDYAVIETGMGGLFDGTNVVNTRNKVAVITKIGYDHVGILGNTLPEIALQKAGIIQAGNTVIVAPQDQAVLSVFRDRAKIRQAKYVRVSEHDFTVKKITTTGTIFVDTKRQLEMTLSLIGAHQAENAVVAREVIDALSESDDWKVEEESLAKAWSDLRMPARMDVISTQKNTLIIDGAHNTQKMDAFLSALHAAYPAQKFVFLVAFKQGKDSETMIHAIEKLAQEIVITDFRVESQDMVNISEDPKTIASYIFAVPHMIIPGAQEAITYATSKERQVVVTGSLYFASEVYKVINK
ncbi:hypothetical protein KBD81_04435 [Candidatus Woesebacteria bacterium]|nr:hypothetical protein [Candidatus Woesebacteria bacterium]